jgi:hypothetical protein
MGLDIGIISMQYLERPLEIAYEFAWELAAEASTNGYMHEADNSYLPFSRRRIGRLLDRFAKRKALTQE